MSTKKSRATLYMEKLMGGPQTFGKMIEGLRICDEISQAELARRMKMTRSNLCAIEKGRRGVSIEMAAKFARTLEYSVDYFVKVAIQDQLRKAGLKITIDVKAA